MRKKQLSPEELEDLQIIDRAVTTIESQYDSATIAKFEWVAKAKALLVEKGIRSAVGDHIKPTK